MKCTLVKIRERLRHIKLINKLCLMLQVTADFFSVFNQDHDLSLTLTKCQNIIIKSYFTNIVWQDQIFCLEKMKSVVAED